VDLVASRDPSEVFDFALLASGAGAASGSGSGLFSHVSESQPLTRLSRECVSTSCSSCKGYIAGVDSGWEGKTKSFS
jgi:hypothetical protein